MHVHALTLSFSLSLGSGKHACGHVCEHAVEYTHARTHARTGTCAHAGARTQMAQGRTHDKSKMLEGSLACCHEGAPWCGGPKYGLLAPRLKRHAQTHKESAFASGCPTRGWLGKSGVQRQLSAHGLPYSGLCEYLVAPERGRRNAAGQPQMKYKIS